MKDMKERKLSAYKAYFQKKYKEEVEKILNSSNKLKDADAKLERTINQFDEAWAQVYNFYYNDDSEEEEED